MRFLIFIIVSIAAGTRFLSLNGNNLSLDEGYSALLSQIPLTSIFYHAGLDSNPPLANAFYHIWCNFVDFNSHLMRLPGVLASIFSVYLVFRLFKPLVGDESAMLIALFKSLSLCDILYARQIRIYPIAETILILSWFHYRNFFNNRSTSSIIKWAIVSGLACHLHYFCFLIVGSSGIILLGAMCRDSKSLKTVSKALIVLLVVVAPLSVPLYQQLFIYKSFAWIERPRVSILIAAAFQLSGYSQVLLCLSLVLIYSLFILRNPKDKTAIPVAWTYSKLVSVCSGQVVLVSALAFFLSLLGGSFFHPRYFFFLQIPMLCLISLGIRPFPAMIRNMFVIGIALVMCNSTFRVLYIYVVESHPQTSQSGAYSAVVHKTVEPIFVHTSKCSFVRSQVLTHFKENHRLLKGKEDSNMFHYPGQKAVFISQEEVEKLESVILVQDSREC